MVSQHNWFSGPETVLLYRSLANIPLITLDTLVGNFVSNDPHRSTCSKPVFSGLPVLAQPCPPQQLPSLVQRLTCHALPESSRAFGYTLVNL